MANKTVTNIRTDNAAVAPTGTEPIESVQSATSAAFVFAELANSPLNAQVGTAYTLAITDQSKTVTMDNAAANILTIPLNASVAFHIGAKLLVRQKGAGGTTVVGDGGVTVELDANASLVMDGAQQQILLHKTATDTWHAAPVATGSGGVPASSAAQGARVSQSGTQSAIDTSTTRVEWDTEDYDDFGFGDLGTNNERLTVPAGISRVNTTVFVEGSAMTNGNSCRLAIHRYNSADAFQETVASSRNQVDGTQCSASTAAVGVEVVAGDYLVATVNHNDASWQINDTFFSIQDATVGTQATVAFHGALIEEESSAARTGASFTPTFDVEVYDTDGFGDLGSNNDRLTIPAGVTKVDVTAHLDVTGILAGSDCFLSISRFNSADSFQRAYGSSMQNGDAGIFTITSTGIIEVVEGDYFKVVAQSSDTSWNQTYASLGIEYKDGTLTESAEVLTTKGDLMAHSTAPERLPVGTDGQVLTADSAEATGVKWAGKGLSGCRVVRTTDLAMDGNQTIDWDTTPTYDDDAWYDGGVSTEYFTIPAGVTRVDIMAQFYSDDSTIAANSDFTIIFDHANSSDVSQAFFPMGIVTSAGTIPSHSAMLMGYPVTPTDRIRIRLVCGDTSYNVTQAQATIRDVTP